MQDDYVLNINLRVNPTTLAQEKAKVAMAFKDVMVSPRFPGIKYPMYGGMNVPPVGQAKSMLGGAQQVYESKVVGAMQRLRTEVDRMVPSSQKATRSMSMGMGNFNNELTVAKDLIGKMNFNLDQARTKLKGMKEGTKHFNYLQNEIQETEFAVKDLITRLQYLQRQQLGVNLPTQRTGELNRMVAARALGPQRTGTGGWVGALGLTNEQRKWAVSELEAFAGKMGGGAKGESPFGMATRRVTLWGGAAFMIYGTLRVMQQLVREVVELDKALVGLHAVMRDASADFGQLTDLAFDLGQQYGRSATEIIKGMTEIAKTGVSQVELMQMIKVAVLAANVAEIELSESAKILTAVQEQFNLTTNDLIDVVDSWNEISRKARVSTADLIEAVQVAGTSAGETGVSFHQLNAIVATVAQATGRGGNEIATAFKAMMARGQMPKAVEALSEIGVTTKDASGDLRDFSAILDDVASRWNTLTRAQKMNVANALAEKKRYQYFLSLMENYDKYLEMVRVSLTSTGSAEAENAILMESLAKKYEQFKTTLQEMKLGLTSIVQTLGEFSLQGLTAFSRLIDLFLRIPGAKIAASIGAIVLAFKALDLLVLQRLMESGGRFAGGVGKAKGALFPLISGRAFWGTGGKQGYLGGMGNKYWPLMPQTQITQYGQPTAFHKYPTVDMLAADKKVAQAMAGRFTVGQLAADKQAAKLMTTPGVIPTAGYTAMVRTPLLEGTKALGKGIKDFILPKAKSLFQGIGNFLFSPVGLFMTGSMIIGSLLDNLHQAEQRRIEQLQNIYENAKQAATEVGDEYEKHETKISAIHDTLDYVERQLKNQALTEDEINSLQKTRLNLLNSEKVARKELTEYAEQIAQKYPFLVTMEGGQLTINEPALQSWKELEKTGIEYAGDAMKQAALEFMNFVQAVKDSGKELTLYWRDEGAEWARNIANLASLTLLNKFQKPKAGWALGTPGTPGGGIFLEDMFGSAISELANAMIPLFGHEMVERAKKGEPIIVETEEQLDSLLGFIQSQLVFGIENWEERMKVAAYTMGYSYDELGQVVEDYKSMKLSEENLNKLAKLAFMETGEEMSNYINLILGHFKVLEMASNAEETYQKAMQETIGTVIASSMALEDLQKAVSALSFLLEHAMAFKPEGIASVSQALGEAIDATYQASLTSMEAMLTGEGGIVQAQNQLTTVRQTNLENLKTLAETYSEEGDVFEKLATVWDTMPQIAEEMQRNRQLDAVTNLQQTWQQFMTADIMTPEIGNLGQVIVNAMKNLFPEDKEIEGFISANQGRIQELTTTAIEQQLSPREWAAGIMNIFIERASQNDEVVRRMQEYSNGLILEAEIESKVIDLYGSLADAAEEANAKAQMYYLRLKQLYWTTGAISSDMMQSLVSISQSIGGYGGFAGTFRTQTLGGLTNLVADMKSGKIKDLNLGLQLAGEMWNSLASQEKSLESSAESAADSANQYFSNLRTALDHFKALDRTMLESYREMLQYLESIAPTLADKIKLQEEIYKLEQEIITERIDTAKNWIDHEMALEKMNVAEKTAYYQQMQTMVTQRADRWKLEEELFKLEKEIVDDRIDKAEKWISHWAAMDAITKESQLSIYKKILQMASGADVYTKWELEEKIHKLEKELAGEGESDFAKRIVRRAAGLQSPLRISLEEYKKFMGEGKDATEEAKDMLKEFEEYMSEFGGTGREAQVVVGDLSAIVKELISTERDNILSTSELKTEMLTLGEALNAEATAAAAAQNATAGVSQELQDIGKQLLDMALGLETEVSPKVESLSGKWKIMTERLDELDRRIQPDVPGLGAGIFGWISSLLESLATIAQGGAGVGAGSAPAGAVGPPIMFPVPPWVNYSYGNDWGAPRRGHTHQGNDIFAPMGSPAVAVAPGVVTHHSGGNAGNYIGLHSVWGDLFYYMHMMGFTTPNGATVFPGQLIGLVGDTGNARGGPPHIHFEWHPQGGAATNPYNYLRTYDPRAMLRLDTGGQVLSDGLAMVHKKEVWINPPLVKKLEQSVDRPSIKIEYQDNSSITLSGLGMSAEEVRQALEEYSEKKGKAIAKEVHRLI